MSDIITPAPQDDHVDDELPDEAVDPDDATDPNDQGGAVHA